MRVLFDQGTPVPLRKHLAGHDVGTAFESGWSELSNGELLRKAEEQFDVLVTRDKQLRYQQNLTGRRSELMSTRFLLVTAARAMLEQSDQANHERSASGCPV